VYLADVNNYRVRLLTPNAPVCTFAVSPTSLTAPALGGNLNATIQTTTGCAWTVSGLPSWITVSGSPSGSGNGTVSLVFAPNNSPSQLSATVTVAGIPVTVTQPFTVLLITAGGVVNVASYTTPVAPGSLAAVFGNFLLPSPVTATLFPIPTGLGGLSLQFSGAASTPLFYANAGQTNAQIPWELSGSTQTTVIASMNGQNSAPQSVELATYAPGIFTINGEGIGQGAIVDPNYRVVDPTNPATAGSTVIQIYCTGLGPVTNQPATGTPAPSGPLALTTTRPVVMIGGAQASVQYSGLTPTEVGVYQVNALVPAGSAKGNSVPVTISIGGVQSNAVTIAVQ
jgi:uncharacterized protein (TIGR03437 family)